MDSDRDVNDYLCHLGYTLSFVTPDRKPFTGCSPIDVYMGFAVDTSGEGRESSRDPHPRNVYHDLVEYSRANQVLNEAQTLTTFSIYFSGLLPKWKDYTAGLITGGSGGGKSHMKQNVVDRAFAYVDGWLYSPTGFSAKAIQDDDEWDSAKIAALNELNKIPPETLEFLKSAHGDDGGFDYRRNVSDPESDSGFTAKKLTSEPKPVVAMMADENEFDVESELQTRMFEIKVDENEEKNRAVHRMKWGHSNIAVDGGSYEGEYVWEDDDLDHLVRSHIKGMEAGLEGVDDVYLPTGDGRCDGDDWDAAAVVEPMMNFKRSESARASSMMASLCKASAAANYHARETATVEGDAVLVAAPEDVANLIAMRDVLLATTHGLTSKKFAIIDAIMAVGGQANRTGTALQATKGDILNHIKDNPNVATMTEPEVRELLISMDEHLLLNKEDHPEDARKNIYVYDGESTFDAPNIMDYYEHFENVCDPITGRPIEETVERQLEELHAKLDIKSALTAEPEDDTESHEGGLSRFEEGGDGLPSDLDETASAVAERLAAVLDDRWVDADVMAENNLKVSHMIGETPTNVEEDGDRTYVSPSRPLNGGDRASGMLNPDFWDEADSFDDVDALLDDAIVRLRDEGVISTEADENGDVYFMVET